uniref:Uncharacterized protein n=1 Tax=viral metagenome TaxID=1070528 RepID=A0A6C0IDG1_9ZZZZ
MLSPQSTNPAAGCQLNNLVFQYLTAVETTPGMNPPQASRLYFLLGSLMWNSYASLDKTFSFVDGFTTPTQYLSSTTSESDRWNAFYKRLVLCLQELQQQEVPSMPVPPLPTGYPPVNPQFRASVKAYLAQRWNDGHLHTSQGFTYPNEGHYIRVGGPLQNLNEELPDPTTWCPLSVLQPDGTWKNQKYVAPLFYKVKNWFSQDEWTKLYDIAETNHPSPQVWEQQIHNTETLCSTVNVQEKVIAEIWAGTDPKKATPPTKWMIFMCILLAAKEYPTKESVALIGGLSFTLFHAGITAWAVKTKYLQPRPIQVMRQEYYNKPLVNPITGEEVNGGEWLPYQSSQLWTPGFPDYVSGHSVFSMGCAVFLQMLTGSDKIPLDGVMIDTEYLRLWGHIFDECTEPFMINQVPMPPGCSVVNPEKDPNCPVYVGWTSWNAMANEVGMSRIWGFIHWENSNMGGLALGSQVGQDMMGRFDWAKMKLRF